MIILIQNANYPMTSRDSFSNEHKTLLFNIFLCYSIRTAIPKYLATWFQISK